MDHPRSNNILERLGEEAFRDVGSSGSMVKLPQGQVLAEPLGGVGTVYFPVRGAVSFVVQMSSADLIEAGIVGRDGVVGADEALNDMLAVNQMIVQVAGAALAIPAERFKELHSMHEPLRRNVATFRQIFLAQVQQTAACNATHRIDARFCRWLLRVRDLAGDEFSLTQEFIAQMLGVQRASVSTEAHKLQEAGLISYKRGHIQLTNPSGLLDAACECYGDVKRYEDALMTSTKHKHNGLGAGEELPPLAG
jgi:CRP-like cAMP-binding protein